VIAVNDAYRRLPFAEILYACDARWWQVHKGCPDFQGERWSSHGIAARIRHNDKGGIAERYGVKLVAGEDREGFSIDPDVIHYGSNSGFQAVNLAMLMGARRIVLVGFDMHAGKGLHFFGNHPAPLRNTNDYANFIQRFARAAQKLPDDIQIVNATQGSALTCFKRLSIDDALAFIA
jgi:hypothetical protein